MIRQRPCILSLSGELDIYRRRELHDAFLSLQSEPRVIIDLTKAIFCDGTLLSELALLRKARKAERFEPVHLVVQSPSIRRLLTLVEFDKIFPLHATLAEAQAEL